MKKALLFRLAVLVAAIMSALGASAVEAYACYTSSNTTLTFYYDDQRDSRPGTTYGLNTGNNSPGWVSDGTNANVTKVAFNSSFAGARPTSTHKWFDHMENLTGITGISYLKTSEVTDMGFMFNKCSGLTSLDLSCFNTSKVTDMPAMFQGCERLTSLDVSGFNTANVTDMEYMFSGCYVLASLGLSSFNTANVTNMQCMFQNCVRLAAIFVGYNWSTAAVTASSDMFLNCIRLVGGQGTTFEYSNPTDKTYAHIDGGPGDPGYLTDPNASSLTIPYACYTPSNSTLTFYYDDQRFSRPGTTYYLNKGERFPGWYSDSTNANVAKVVFDPSFAEVRPTTTYMWFDHMKNLTRITGIPYLNTSEVTNMCLMFHECSGLTSLDLSSFNTSKVTDMALMFAGCSGLTSLDLSSFNTTKVTNMASMFAYCRGLTSLNLSSFNTSQVTDMRSMFLCCIRLASLDLSGFNTANVTEMNSMFSSCTDLTSLDLSSFNTSQVTSMWHMFAYCSGLTRLDVSSFNTANVTDMANMFGGCSGLTSLDLSSFNTSKVTDTYRMFAYCDGLTTIYVGNGWSTSAVTKSNNMFENCTKLVGSKGTRYSYSNPKDKTYAHIDGGPSNPGYFSDANGSKVYACYTRSNGTLTFYCDKKRSSRPGMTYDLNIGDNDPDWYDDGTYAIVSKVVFDPSFADARPTTTYNWFGEMEQVVSITGINYLNTSEVTNMAFMFYGCTGMRSLDVSGFNTSKVTDMSSMFKFCNSMRSLDLSSFNTAQVTDMKMMFQNCLNLKTIFVGSEWSTAAVTSSADMFLRSTTLVGGQGTTYNGYHVDASYAHIDGGASDPGYLTDIQIAMQPYAALSSDSRTLTFYKDGMITAHTEPTFLLNEPDQTPGWSTYCNIITTVAFDPSFAPARPTYMGDWFNGMSNLTSITGMEYLNTSQVTSMHGLFHGCSSLASVDLSNFDTGNVTDMNSMFRDCAALQSLAVSSFDTRNVTDMNAMFRGCTGLTELDLSSFNTANVTKMIWMFYKCTNLVTIFVGADWNTSNVTTSAAMFGDCTSLVGGQGTTYDANHVDKTYAHIDGGPSNPGYLTRDPNAPEAYASYHAGYSTLTFYYDNQKSSRPGEIFDLNEGSENPDWYDNGWSNEVTKVVFDPSFADARPTTTVNWFAEMYELTSVEGIENLNTSEVTDMGGMFWECGSLPYVDVSGFDTHNVTNMNSMFAECYELTGLDVSGFDTRNVTSMESMFGNCSELTFLDVSGFNTAKVTSMYNLFGGCGLTSLDLRSFDTHNVTNMCYMFSSCSELKTIYVGEGWTTAGVTISDEMFYYCLSIVGGQGTTYDPSNPKDKTYAHIDGGPSNPGYFTAPPEAYACYTPSNTTLTFYYDSQRASRTGTTYDLNTGNTDVAWDTDGTNYNVTKVVFDPSFAGARPTTTCDWFYGMGNLESITGMSYLNTSEVTNMNWMFMECYKLTSLDLSHFNTSKVTWMTEMFRGCSSLTSLDLSSFNTANVTKMQEMFYNSYHLQIITVGDNWSTAAVTYSTDMFNNCTNLVGGKGTTYDANHVDKTYAHIDGGTSNPGYFTAPPEAYACYTPSNTTLTFYYDNQRASRTGMTYDLNTGEYTTGWETDGTNANVTKVVFDPSFADARPTTTYAWFHDMENLQSITGIEYLNTSEVTNMASMFTRCESLTSLDLSHFNTSKVADMNFMFDECLGFTSLDLSSFNTSKVRSMNWMFSDCIYLQTIYVGNGWSTAAVEYSNNMFYYCLSIVGGQGTTWNNSNPKDKTYAHIDGGPSNPGYFTEFKEAYACYTPSNTTLTFYYDDQRSSRSGTTYDLNTGSNDTGWDTDGTNASVTKVVFDPSFAGARPTTTYDWFYGMGNLESITGMSYLNTSEVTNMAYMFMWCTSLTSLDVSRFNTSKVTSMRCMFKYCTRLTSLDLGSFNTHNVTDMDNMFYNCDKLHTIYGTDWDTGAVTASSDMFTNCFNLVGGKGTAYSSSNPKDKTYAHIDGGTSNPGYFSEKGGTFLRGDVNGDGHVSIADVSALIDYLLSGETAPAGADCNQSGNVSIADVSSLIDYLLSGQWP